jgi:hypothetical protein
VSLLLVRVVSAFAQSREGESNLPPEAITIVDNDEGEGRRHAPERDEIVLVSEGDHSVSVLLGHREQVLQNLHRL